ncbi:MAG TPA: deoxynucleoside kinase, partial [Candidatus Doudnabacteria bacterium]|nr:deoxynucleoside kinase [Candidatus Doudnabacteria bacterium]
MAIWKKTEQPITQPGKFIVIEGADGTGKTTQVQLLAKTLGSYEYNGVVFDFPQYAEVSSALLSNYLKGKYGQLNPEAASILYAVDRFDASFAVREHLKEGRIVLANRYVSSNAGHQGAKINDATDRIKFFKWLDHLEFTTFNIPRPDLTIILHLPVEMSLDLIKKGHEAKGTRPDLHDQDLEHLQRAEQVYLEIAELFPNTKLVECSEDGRL